MILWEWQPWQVYCLSVVLLLVVVAVAVAIVDGRRK